MLANYKTKIYTMKKINDNPFNTTQLQEAFTMLLYAAFNQNKIATNYTHGHCWINEVNIQIDSRDYSTLFKF